MNRTLTSLGTALSLCLLSTLPTATTTKPTTSSGSSGANSGTTAAPAATSSGAVSGGTAAILVDDLGVFELDGNHVDDPAGPPCSPTSGIDWLTVNFNQPNADFECDPIGSN